MYALSVPGRGRASSRVRPFILLAAFLVAAPLVTGVVPPESPSTAAAPSGLDEPGPTNPSPDQGPLDLKRPATVTLITGDKVTVYPDGSVETKPGPGRGDIVFEEQTNHGAIHVVPSDATRLLAEDKLDERLFDLTYLIREGYDDVHRGGTPLIVQGEPARVRDVTAGPGVKIKRQSPKLKMSTLTRSKTMDRGRLWSRMTGQGTKAGSLPSGVQKIWLDGAAHVTLDESVPQIGAPSVWESGYTGEGVKVAVLDTGVDTTHPDLAGQVVAEKVFAESTTAGLFNVDQLGRTVEYRWMNGALWVPKDGASDPVVYVGRACTETEGDELLADPEGKTALILRGPCPFAEKYDAVVDAGATGVVIYNDEPGIFAGTVESADNAWAVWAATISDADGIALVDLLDAQENVVIDFTDLPIPGDPFGHGTHVASTIAGAGAASDGQYTGVAPDAKVMNGRVCDETGSCQESWILAGMEWAANNGADIVNMSLSGTPTDGTDPLSQAVDQLTADYDTLFVIAAGNAGDIGVGTPGTADAALTVGAVDKSDELAWFSSRGPRRGDQAVKPNITAPGVGIMAARATRTSMGSPVDADYTSADGTSMATPHVAGAAALLAQAHPDLDADELNDALASTAIDGGYLWSEQGTGRLDVARAVRQRVYADASINFGSLDRDDGPVQRQITYTNHTNQVVTLRLESALTDTLKQPVSAANLSRSKLVVRPAQDASVTVTIDPQALDKAGIYGGVIAAAGSDISLRTAVGFGVKREVVPLPDDWDEDWTGSYTLDGPTAGVDLKGAALGPDGKQIFLYGAKEFGVDPKLIVMAIDASTGEEIWSASKPVSYVSAVGDPGIAVAPDGSKVYVTQNVYDQNRSQLDVITLAYNNTSPQDPGDPQLGEQLWQATYEDISPFRNTHPGDILRIAATPDGQTVMLVGSQVEPKEGDDECLPPLSSCMTSMLTIAYDAATGGRSWIARYKGPTNNNDVASDVTISPDSELAYVSGSVHLDSDHARGITIAYELAGDAKGKIRWATHHGDHLSNGPFQHSVLSEDGKRLLVTGTATVDRSPADFRMETKGLDAASGDLLWTSTFGAADHGFSPGHTEPDWEFRGGTAAGPNDDLVFATGQHCEGGNCTGAYAIVTVAFDQLTGEERWHQIHETTGPPTSLGPRGVTATTSPDGTQLYVAGTCCIDTDRSGNSEQTTLAYDTVTGELLAVARHQFEGWKRAEGLQVLVSPDGSTIYTVGEVGWDSWGISAYSPPIPLSASPRRVHGSWHIDLMWSGAVTEKVDVYRDGEPVATVENTGSHTDDVGHVRQGETFTYQVCAASTQHCSTQVTVKVQSRRGQVSRVDEITAEHHAKVR